MAAVHGYCPKCGAPSTGERMVINLTRCVSGHIFFLRQTVRPLMTAGDLGLEPADALWRAP